MIIPLITVLTEPSKLLEYILINDLSAKFGIIEPTDLVLPIIILFISVIIFSTLVRVSSIKVSADFSFLLGSKLSTKVYTNILYRSYEEHKNINSSEDISKLISKINTLINGLIFPFVMLANAILMLVAIAILFVFVNVYLTMSILVGLVTIYLMVTMYFKSKLKKNSIIIASNQDRHVQLVQESTGGIQDIILNTTFGYFIDKYKQIDFSIRKNQALIVLTAQMPRFLIECFSIIFLILISYYFAYISEFIPKNILLAVFITLAMTLQRILPIAQQAYRSWANIEGSKQSLLDVFELMTEPHHFSLSAEKNEITFNNEISMVNISFKYQNSDILSLNNISLKIMKGEKVGIIGKTGSGKSTFIDLIMGLLKPTSGKLLIDGQEVGSDNIKSWYSLISHVPQSMFLIDGTIYENISFCSHINDIDKIKAKEAGKLACIDEFINQKKNGYFEKVGERGAKLSGGQRQRIGIARSLYKKSPIIILDEATSALDKLTEEKIMNNIYNLKDQPTVFIIAHRLSTLKGCDKIVELENGKIKRICKYIDIEKNSNAVR